jgi:ABC-type phosphate transport system substrate-binding protein
VELGYVGRWPAGAEARHGLHGTGLDEEDGNSMRMLSKLLAGSAAAATLVALAAGPALADPPKGVTPKATDVVGVGSDTTTFALDQLSHDYNASHKSGAKLYSWDALNPTTGAVGDPIVTKAGCASIPRPDGSSAGITALDANTADGTGFCIDFARSSRGRASTDPPYATGGIAFTALAGDAVTYATRSKAAGGTNAPANLTTAQLASIYECNVTNWDQLTPPGPNATIAAFLPQSGSGTRSFFLTALGGGVTPITPGACVNSTVQENEGVDPQLNSPNAIVPFSVAKYIAEAYHSAKCINTDCSPNSSGVVCTPGTGQNLYGCDTHGVLTLDEINSTAPTTPWPLPAKGAKVTINTGFTPLFQRTVYDVVRYDSTTTDHIPAYLEKFFAAATAKTKGWVCSSSAAKTDLKNYGFLVIANCGLTN